MYQKDHTRRVESFDLRVKIALLVVSLATLALLAVAAYRENFLPEWRSHQLRYREVLEEKAESEADRKLAQDFQVELRQLVVPALGAVDRCISCHVGFDDPRMADQPNPFKTHPGDYLAVHDPARFGCTSCHLGQGRATERDAAHGDVPHWDEPMVEREFLYSVCTRCHSEADLYAAGYGELDATGRETPRGPETRTGGRELIARGRELVREKGCLGCHAYRGKGGTLGPDLTHVGDKTRHDFDFSSFRKDEPREVRYWLEKHFREPERVSPGTVMPPMDVSDEDVDALTAYMLSLKRKSAPPAYRPPPRAGRREEASGEELYGLFCAACHGKDGRESEVPGLRTPALNNADFLAVAGDDYLRHIVEKGRSGTKMPAWGGRGGLTRAEIDRLVAYVRSWEPTPPDLRGISSIKGSAARGRALYRGNCANCHGHRGDGGIGNALDSATFLAVASDDFLARSIVWGRPGTAMPSWKSLGAQQVSDILAYLRSWHERDHDPEILVSLARTLGGRLELGRTAYAAHCSSCHGNRGEGGIGVNLRSEDFLRRASHRYLIDALLEGRPGTAMPSWSHLTTEQIAGIIAYIKSWQKGPDIAVDRATPRGDWRLGEVVYGTSCASCHGTYGQGGSGPQITNPAFLRAATDAMLYDWIAHGKTGTAMKGFLPEAQGITSLRPSQIHDVIAYLRRRGMEGEPVMAREGAGDPRHGAEIYQGSCAPCHGAHGEGASGPQLNNPAFLESATDGFLTATIVLGRTGTAMRSMVHGQEGLGQINPEDVSNVVAYLRLWSHPATWRLPRPAVEMTREAVESGQRAYNRFCAGCHGPEGRGVSDGEDYFAPALNNPEFLEAASDGYLLATIARGRSGTPMRAFGKWAGGIAELSGRMIQDIVSYIRSWDRSPAPEPARPLTAGIEPRMDQETRYPERVGYRKRSNAR